MLKRRKNASESLLQCPVEVCMSFIGGSWTPNIFWYLKEGPRRFSELRDDIGRISPKVLTQRLRKLEKDGLIHRQVVPSSPPTVEYSLTELGSELKPAIDAIVRVGLRLQNKKTL